MEGLTCAGAATGLASLLPSRASSLTRVLFGNEAVREGERFQEKPGCGHAWGWARSSLLFPGPNAVDIQTTEFGPANTRNAIPSPSSYIQTGPKHNWHLLKQGFATKEAKSPVLHHNTKDSRTHIMPNHFPFLFPLFFCSTPKPLKFVKEVASTFPQIFFQICEH